MSTEEFKTIKIQYKGAEHDVQLRQSLKFGEFGLLMKRSGFDIATNSVKDVQAFMTNLIQFTVHKAPFDHKDVKNILDLDTKVAMKIFTEALSALPLSEISADLGVNLPDSLQNLPKT